MTDQLITPETLAEIETRKRYGTLPPASILLTVTERDALCRTLRAAWKDRDDFLLSLLDSQATEIRLLRKASAEQCGDYGATVYNGEGNYTLLAQNAVDHAATRMRDKCVAKIRERADRLSVDAMLGGTCSGLIATALRSAALELESLTLGAGEQK